MYYCCVLQSTTTENLRLYTSQLQKRSGRIHNKFLGVYGFCACSCKYAKISTVNEAKRDSIGLGHEFN
jgi:hypothetical protein